MAKSLVPAAASAQLIGQVHVFWSIQSCWLWMLQFLRPSPPGGASGQIWEMNTDKYTHLTSSIMCIEDNHQANETLIGWYLVEMTSTFAL